MAKINKNEFMEKMFERFGFRYQLLEYKNMSNLIKVRCNYCNRIIDNLTGKQFLERKWRCCENDEQLEYLNKELEYRNIPWTIVGRWTTKKQEDIRLAHIKYLWIKIRCKRCNKIYITKLYCLLESFDNPEKNIKCDNCNEKKIKIQLSNSYHEKSFNENLLGGKYVKKRRTRKTSN